MLHLPAIFSNHAILQQKKPIFIWGESDTETVWILLKNQKGNIVEELELPVDEGHFIGTLEPRNAGGPYTLTFRAGAEKKEFTDLWFGEVWLAGGQSNMELELRNSYNGQAAVADAADPQVRLYFTPKIAWVGDELLAKEEATEWVECTPEMAQYFSAVGYYFARKLAKKLGVKVGIISCNWGGTSASAWMSRFTLCSNPATRVYWDRYEQQIQGRTEEEYLKALAAYEIYQAEFDKNVGNYYATAENPTWEEAISLFGENQYPGPMGSRSWTRPAGLYESMLSRVAPYSLQGFIYYQGEDDDNRPYLYETLLTSLIQQWRQEDWMDEDATFLTVQLPIFCNEGEIDDQNWPFLREAQMAVSRKLPKVGCAVTLEVGEYHNIHPLNKETVGERLMKLACEITYGCMSKEEAEGPVFAGSSPCHSEKGKGIQIEIGNAREGIRIAAKNPDFVPNSLAVVRPGDESLGFGVAGADSGESLGFELAGSDGIYYPADPIEDLSTLQSDINGKITFTLISEAVPEPVYARYFWTNYREVRILGKNGIPLAPFRTNPADGARAVGTRQGKLLE